jgi:glycosyltransferase involved in cell wall biosynthesis
MRILGLSWRYLDHPAAGGAEIVTHQIFTRLVDQGHDVTSFTGSYPGAPPEGELDGVRLIRQGRQWTVHILAWRWLRERLDDFDIVIDQINTIPFFTPLYVPAAKRRFLFHQLAREYWWRETRGAFKAIAPIGYVTEPLYLRAYRRTFGVTGSESSRRDLEALGFRRDRVELTPYPVDVQPLAELPRKKPSPWTVLMVGRLTPAKFVEDGVRVFAAFRASVPDARLEIVGSGDDGYRRKLERLAGELGIVDATVFHGRVAEEHKLELMRRAHVHVFASRREGWGLVVSECGAMGTPSIGYDAPGVLDSIADPRMLAPTGDLQALVRLLRRLHDHVDLYADVRRGAWERARAHSPRASTAAFVHAMGIHDPTAATLAGPTRLGI